MGCIKAVQEKFHKYRGTTNFMILFLSFSNVLSNGMNIISGLLVARWVLPETLGTFNSFTLIAGYLVYLQVGVNMAFGREFPLHLGKNERELAHQYAAGSQFWALLLASGVGFFAFLGIVLNLLKGDYQSAAGFLVIAVSAFESFFITQYLKILYRSNKDFNKLSIINLCGAFTLLLSISFVYLWGFYGLCVRTIAGATVQFYLAYKWRPTKVKPFFDRSALRHLFRIGVPMFLVSTIITLWPLLQRTITLEFGGVKSLGLFAIPAVVLGSMSTLSGAVSSVIYPTMSIAWGKGESVGQLLKKSLRPLLTNTCIFAVAIPFGWYFLPILIEVAMPNYIASLEAARWMMIVGLISSFNVWIDIYNVVNRQMYKLVAVVSGIVSWYIAFLILYNRGGFKLEILPQSICFGYLALIICHLIFVSRHSNHTIHTLK
jgi:O-antigen/teichoic acid export membrane protein